MSYVKIQSMQRGTWVLKHMGLFNADQLRFQVFAKLVETSWYGSSMGRLGYVLSRPDRKKSNLPTLKSKLRLYCPIYVLWLGCKTVYVIVIIT